jgi:hypothetical protein
VNKKAMFPALFRHFVTPEKVCAKTDVYLHAANFCIPLAGIALVSKRRKV